MLMDAFYKSLEARTESAACIFTNSCKTVHHAPAQCGALAKNEGIKEVGAELAAGLKLLCFDEYEVSDVTDAMILSKLFREMADAGVVFVFTSNKRPDEHYKEGLQRASYLNFACICKARWKLFRWIPT